MSNPIQELAQKTKELSAPVKQSPVQEVKPAVSTAPREPVPRTTIIREEPPNEKYHSEFCFVSLALGVFGLVLPLFSVLAILFGIGGLMQTHRENMKGRWMAIVGIILGFLAILAVIAAIIFGWAFLQEYLVRFGGIETLMGRAQGYLNR